MGGAPTGRGLVHELRRYRGPMREHPLRLLVLLAVALGLAAAVRKATSDQGGTYDPDGAV